MASDSINSSLFDKHPDIVRLDALYLGASKVDQLVFEDPVIALQTVLSKLVNPENEISGHGVNIRANSEALNISYLESPDVYLLLPLKYLIYCGAFRKVKDDEKLQYKTLNQIGLNDNNVLDPPVVVLVFKGIGNFIAHVVAVNNNDQALWIINSLMQCCYESDQPPSSIRTDALLKNGLANQALGFNYYHHEQQQQGILVSGSSAMNHPLVDASPQMARSSIDPILNHHIRPDINRIETIRPQHTLLNPNQYNNATMHHQRANNVQPNHAHPLHHHYQQHQQQQITNEMLNADPALKRAFELIQPNNYPRQRSHHIQRPSDRTDVDNKQNVIVRWLRPSEDNSGKATIVREEITRVSPNQGIQILNEELKQQPNRFQTTNYQQMIDSNIDKNQYYCRCGGIANGIAMDGQDNKPIVIIEKYISQKEQIEDKIKSSNNKTNRVLVPITVNETRTMRPNPIVIEHMQPVFKTRKRIKESHLRNKSSYVPKESFHQIIS